jgi:hypothetical protein
VSDSPNEQGKTPSFSAAVEESRARETDARAAAIPAVETPAVETPPADDYDFDKSYGGLPERLRKDAEERYMRTAYESFNAALAQEYGDILPIIAEAKSDPAFRKALSRLSEKDLRQFLFENALPVYEKSTSVAAQPGDIQTDPKVAELEKTVESLQQKISIGEAQTAYDRYATNRTREFEALRNEAGDELTWQTDKDAGYKLADHLIKIAEDRSERAARATGIDTTQPTWYAEALSRNVRMPSYREVYDEWKEIAGRSAPPAAPAGSSAEPPARSGQAPRDASEGRERALKLLKQTGGLRGLATTASARNRR